MEARPLLKLKVPYEEFLARLKTRATREQYDYGIKTILQDCTPDDFALSALADPDGAEKTIIDFFMARRETQKAVTLRGYLSGLKSFLKRNRIDLSWTDIMSVLPTPRRVGMDRAPTLDEIRKAMDYSDLRLKTVITILASSGVRVGSFEYLNVEHYSRLKSGIGLLIVYANEPEQYYAFISPEAASFLNKYLDDRKRAGEKLAPHSPLIRDKWNYSLKVDQGEEMITLPTRMSAIDLAKRSTTSNLQSILHQTWVKSGVRVIHAERTFKLAHGFRKFFKTRISQGIQNPDDVEVLLGHFLAYYKPTLEHLEEEYLKGVKFVTISESEEAKMENQRVKKESNERADRLELELLKERDARRTMEERIAKIERMIND